MHLAQDKLTGRTVALKVVFLNKAGLTKEQVCVCSCTQQMAAGSTRQHRYQPKHGGLGHTIVSNSVHTQAAAPVTACDVAAGA